MSKYKTVYTEVEVEVDLTDFETEDLIEELEDLKQPIAQCQPMLRGWALLPKLHTQLEAQTASHCSEMARPNSSRRSAWPQLKNNRQKIKIARRRKAKLAS